MKRILINLLFLVVTFFSFSARAQVELTVVIFDSEQKTATELTVPETCEVSGQTFTGHKAICALDELVAEDAISSYDVTYWPDYAAYTLDALDDLFPPPDWSSYWSIWLNAQQTSSIDSQTVESGDTLTFYYGGYSETYPIEAETIPLEVIIFDGTNQTVSNINLPESCELDGKDFTEYKAICALDVLVGQEELSEYDISYWESFDAYTLDSLNGIFPTADWSFYWSIWFNEISTSSIDSQSISPNGKLTFYYGAYSETYPLTQSEEEVEEEENQENEVEETQNSDFDLDNAIDFLLSNQNDDGSIGKVYESDWAMLALAATKGNGSHKENAKDYLKDKTDVGDEITSLARRAMVLMALDINPYDGTDTNYISLLLQELENKDIEELSLSELAFTGIALAKSGHADVAQELAEELLDEQDDDGGFTNSVGDYTGPAIEFLAMLEKTDEIDDALDAAQNYLEDVQEENGGFDDIYTTGWNMNGLIALGKKLTDFKHDETGNSVFSYLGENQQDSGRIGEDKDGVWATAYAIPGALGKSWDDILHEFEIVETSDESATVEEVLVIENTTSQAEESVLPLIENAQENLPGEVLGDETSKPETILEPEISEQTQKEGVRDYTYMRPLSMLGVLLSLLYWKLFH